MISVKFRHFIIKRGDEAGYNCSCKFLGFLPYYIVNDLASVGK